MDLSIAPRFLMSMHHWAALGALALFLVESVMLGLALTGGRKGGAERI